MKGKKKEKKNLRGGLVAVVVFLLIAVLRTVFPQLGPAGMSSVNETGDASGLEVHFIDVGQGDATLIKADGHAMLIDAGDMGEYIGFHELLVKSKSMGKQTIIMNSQKAAKA